MCKIVESSNIQFVERGTYGQGWSSEEVRSRHKTIYEMEFNVDIIIIIYIMFFFSEEISSGT